MPRLRGDASLPWTGEGGVTSTPTGMARVPWLGPRLRESLVGLAVLVLGACSAAPVKRTDVDRELPDRVAPIVVGETTRAQVRALLGEPQLTSEYWRFDLFRFSGKNIDIGLLYIVPFSVTQDVDALALVTYDSDGKVVAFDKGSSHALPGWGQHDPPLKIESGELTVVTQVGRTTSLYASAPLRDAYLDAYASHDRCTVLMGCDREGQCLRAWTLDGVSQQPLTWMPPAVATAPRSSVPPPYPVAAWLTPYLIAPGAHELQLLENRKSVASAVLNCAAGETLYVRVDRTIEMFRESPDAFSTLPTLIYRNGWLVPQEPGHE